MLNTLRHRVVVQLKDEALDDDGGATEYIFDGFDWVLAPIAEHAQHSSTTTTEVEICDNRTLKMYQTNSSDTNARQRGLRQLQFDCVGGRTDIQTRAEFNSMLDLLLLQHYNCCLIQFMVQRQSQVSFLSNLLVSELDQRIQKSHACLHGIRLELHDMRKFEIVNLFTKNLQNGRQRPRNHFNNTLELLKWLQSDYTHLCALGRGHSILDVHLHYTDGRRRMHRTKFCIIQISILNMDTDTKSSLKKFFQNHTGEKRLKQTNTIIDCLREYFSGKELWRTWMLFEVPTSNSIGLATEDLLTIASAAYAGSLTINARTNATTLKEKVVSDDSDGSMAESTRSLVRPVKTGSMMLKKTEPENDSAVAVALKSKSHTGVISSSNTRGMTELSALSKMTKAKTKRVEDFSTKDLDSLSNWYAKVDGEYAMVITAMEAFYECKYQSKIGKIGDQIQQIVRTNNVEEKLVEKSSDLLASNKSCSPAALKDMYSKYIYALIAFRKLEKEVDFSQFSDQLQVYLKTKNYELTQHVLRYKMRQLENCRTLLTDVIKKEMNALKALKSTNASMQSIHRNVRIQLTAG